MRSLPLWILILVSLLPVLVACGSSGDDDDDDPGDAAPGASRSSSDTKKGGDSDVKLPAIKAAVYGSGKVHVEVSGDKDQKVDADGNGIAQDGFALFTYSNNDVSVQISFSNESKDEPGGVFVTTKEVVTGGPWGEDCKVTLEQSDGKAKGEFSCDTIDALEPGTAKTHRVKLKGTFTAGP